jgi:tripartite-type tricarboxylate transporter receptor subunit TctC
MTGPVDFRRRIITAPAAAAAGLLLGRAGVAPAQEGRFPNRRQVTLVCPWAPGGIADTTARRLAQQYAALWGAEQVIVENRAGANGNIGAAAVARAAPDGHTLLLTLHDGMVIGKSAKFQMGYDPMADLAAVALVGISDIYWTVKGDSPHKTIGDFVAYAKANPGKVSFGSNGVGSSPHLAMELLNVAAGINIAHVPYRGGAQAVPDVLGGRLDAMMATPALAQSHFQAGSLRPLALVGLKRSSLLPNVPTIAESGYPDVHISLGVGVFAPKGTPQAIVDQINADTRRIVNGTDMKGRFNAEGFPPGDISAAEYQAMIAQEVARMEPLVRRLPNFTQG